MAHGFNIDGAGPEADDSLQLSRQYPSRLVMLPVLPGALGGLIMLLTDFAQTLTLHFRYNQLQQHFYRYLELPIFDCSSAGSH
jgi:hypothetical protein